MREPSIHITKSQFEAICLELGYSIDVNKFFRKAATKAVNSRNILVTNNKVSNQVNKVLLATKGDANMVADIIYATRIKLKHRGVRKIQEGTSRDWTLCKQLANICNEFCQSFNLETRDGFIKYIETGVSRMTDARNLVNRLISMADNIYAQYNAQQELLDMDLNTKDMVGLLHDNYIKRIADATGIYEPFKDNPEKMVHVLRTWQLINKRGFDANDFIDAQFESLSWCNGIPDIANMYGDKAIERYNKYIYKHKRKVSSELKVEGSLWDKINKK